MRNRKIILFIVIGLGFSACASAPVLPGPVRAGCTPLPYGQVALEGIFSPDQHIVAAASDSETAVYDVPTQSLLGCLDKYQGPRPTFTYSADGKFLIAAQSDGFPIKLWRLVPDLQLVFSTASDLHTYDTVLSPDNKLLAILTWDGQGSSHFLGGILKIWNVDNGKLIADFKSIYSIKGFAKDSSQLEVGICTLPETICGATATRWLSLPNRSSQ